MDNRPIFFVNYGIFCVTLMQPWGPYRQEKRAQEGPMSNGLGTVAQWDLFWVLGWQWGEPQHVMWHCGFLVLAVSVRVTAARRC